MNRRQAMAGLGGAALLALAGCTGPRYTHRYRLTITVDTPDGLKSGFSVIEASGADIKALGNSGFGTGVSGDAVFVDLGGGRNLIALLAVGRETNVYLFGLLAPLAFGRNGTKDDFIWIQSHTGSAELGAKYIPTLVTFDDLNDPASARLVDSNRLAVVFGRGHSFAGATVEMTRDPVTRGIEKKLPWLSKMFERGLGGDINSRPGVFTVNAPYFRRD